MNNQHYQRIAQAIHYIHQHQSAQPSLAEIAGELQVSSDQLQREFTQWCGISPKRFLQFLTKEYAKQRLRDSSVLEAALEVGLSGSSRLHDLMVTYEGVTPGEFKTRGAGLVVIYGVIASPFGSCCVVMIDGAICQLSFFDHPDEWTQIETKITTEWSGARLLRDDHHVAHVSECFTQTTTQPLHLLMRGTPFQLHVWQALLRIPTGDIHTYQDVARAIGKPSATRAVASAIARNRIGFLIPCHRVIRNTGLFGDYRWGRARKSALLAWEASKASESL